MKLIFVQAKLNKTIIVVRKILNQIFITLDFFFYNLYFLNRVKKNRIYMK